MKRPLIENMLLLALCCSATGCGGGLRFPGPMGSIGKVPAAYDLSGEETSPKPRAEARDELVDEQVTRGARRRGEHAAGAAVGLVGARKLNHAGRSYRYDCSGFVAAVYARAGMELSGSSANLMDHARSIGVFHRKKQPMPGDVAFFEETYDRNRNGRVDDGVTHVAVVVSVEPDGNVVMVHKGSKGITHLTMNLRQRGVHKDDDGRLLNGYLRVRGRSDPPRTRYLAGELWVGFGSFWKAGERGDVQALLGDDPRLLAWTARPEGR